MSVSLDPEAPPLTVDEAGRVRVAGTRVFLELVVSAHQRGLTAEQIAAQFDALTLADVYGAIGYYLRHRSEVDAYLARAEAEAREARERIGKAQPPFPAKAELPAHRPVNRRGTRPVLGLPAWARAAGLVAAWLPFAWIILFHAPRFAPIFARLDAVGTLPELSRACMWLARLSAETAGLPIVGGMAVVVGLDWLNGRRAERAGRAGRYWAWYAAVAGLGAMAALVTVVGLVVPVGRMGSAVH